ncbi:MAG TPA: signal peptidase II [Candidatus Saccharimonadales bacterium]|nr:signal peptidase II [Candidatus Saccharimonadales bacterium]
MIFPKRLRWLALTLVVAFLDRATKAWIESRPTEYFPHAVMPGYLNIVFSRNPGIAFSFFSDPTSSKTRYLLIAGSLVIIAVIAWMLVATRHLNALSAAGLALLLAGATGNVTDRIVHGAVTDFLQVYVKFIPWHVLNPWPTFNVADSAVTVGAILIILDVLFGEHLTKAA